MKYKYKYKSETPIAPSSLPQQEKQKNIADQYNTKNWKGVKNTKHLHFHWYLDRFI